MNDKISSNSLLNILLLDDSVQDFELIHEQLIEAGYNLNISRVDKETEFASSLRGNKYDIILADFNLPGFNAFGALWLCNQICPEIPFICVSGAIGEETAIELLKQGAVDYVMKDKLERLPFVIERALDQAKEKEELRKTEEELQISEKKYRDLVENSLLGIYTTNIKGKLLFANYAMCKMLEYDSIDELLKEDVKSTYKDKEGRDKFIKKIIKSEKILDYELELVTKKGKTIYVLVSSFLSGEILTGMMMDISERKRAEETLAQQNNALSELNHFSVELSILSFKDNLEALINKRIKEIIGFKMAIFFAYNPENRTLTAQHVEMDPGPREKIISLLGKQLREIHAIVSDEMYRKMTNEIIGMRSTLYDVTFGAISRPVGAAIQALLKIDRFIGVSYLIEGKLYGTSLLALSKDQPDPPEQILENFILLASVSLRRKRAENDLEIKMKEMQRFHNLTVDRELAMIELKKEVNALLKKSGQEKKYRIVE